MTAGRFFYFFGVGRHWSRSVQWSKSCDNKYWERVDATLAFGCTSMMSIYEFGGNQLRSMPPKLVKTPKKLSKIGKNNAKTGISHKCPRYGQRLSRIISFPELWKCSIIHSTIIVEWIMNWVLSVFSGRRFVQTGPVLVVPGDNRRFSLFSD